MAFSLFGCISCNMNMAWVNKYRLNACIIACIYGDIYLFQNISLFDLEKPSDSHCSVSTLFLPQYLVYLQ